MAAANTDKVRQGASGISTTLSSSISNTDTTWTPASISNIPTVTAVDITIDRVDSSGALTPSKLERVIGVVSGGNIVSILRGQDNTSAQAHTTGAVIEMMPTGKWSQDLVLAWLAQHNQDGSHGVMTATSLTVPAAGLTEGAESLQTMRSQYTFDYVASGCVITGTGYGSTLGWSMTSGVVFIGGKPLTVAAASGTVTASKDTYFDLLDPGTGTVANLVNTGGNIVANNAASPALAASSVRIGIVVSGANIANLAAINQGQEDKVVPIVSSVPYTVTDSLGNLICPRDPNRRLLGYRQIVANPSNFTSTSAVQITGLSAPILATGRKLSVTLFIPYAQSGAGLTAGASLWDGTVGSGTKIGESDFSIPASQYVSYNVNSLVTPAVGSKTYNAGFTVSGNAVTVNAGVGFPAFIKIEQY